MYQWVCTDGVSYGRSVPPVAGSGLEDLGDAGNSKGKLYSLIKIRRNKSAFHMERGVSLLMMSRMILIYLMRRLKLWTINLAGL
jgi:hypothetical protein